MGAETLDEAPFACRSMPEIAEQVKDTVEITEILKFIYNFRVGNRKWRRHNFMIVQISTGKGLSECQLAVAKLFEAF